MGVESEDICSLIAASFLRASVRRPSSQPFAVASVRPASAATTASTPAAQSATMPSSRLAALVISSATMSICASRTLGAKRGARPNWKIQLKRPPTISTASAPARAEERAAFMHIALSSGTTPRPIGEAT